MSQVQFIKREPTVKEEELKNSPTTTADTIDTIDLTVGDDDDDEGIRPFLSHLNYIKGMLFNNHPARQLNIENRVRVLNMFTKKFGQGQEVMDEFIDWSERKEIDTGMMKWVAEVLDIVYEEMDDMMVWEEKKGVEGKNVTPL